MAPKNSTRPLRKAASNMAAPVAFQFTIGLRSTEAGDETLADRLEKDRRSIMRPQ
jgi:hypothetical protein